MDFEIKPEGFRDFYLATKDADIKIASNLRKELRKSAKPVAEDVKRAARSIPSDPQHPIQGAPKPRVSIREAMAQSVKIAIKAAKKRQGVFLRIDAKLFAAIAGQGGRTGVKLGKLPRYMEGRIKRWKHPVFGRAMDKPQDWPTQKAHPFFRPTVTRHKKDFEKAVEKATNDALVEITKKSKI